MQSIIVEAMQLPTMSTWRVGYLTAWLMYQADRQNSFNRHHLLFLFFTTFHHILPPQAKLITLGLGMDIQTSPGKWVVHYGSQSRKCSLSGRTSDSQSFFCASFLFGGTAICSGPMSGRGITAVQTPPGCLLMGAHPLLHYWCHVQITKPLGLTSV